MKSTLRKTSCLFLILALGLTLLPIDPAFARGGRGGGGGGRGGGGGASPRMSSGGANRSGGGMQNRGSFDSGSRSQSRSTGQANRQSSQQNRQGNSQNRQDNRQTGSQDRQGNRQDSQQNRQGERTQRTDTRQGERTERTDTRQQGATDRQNNRQNFVDDNRNWVGGGWYGGGYGVPPGWGLVGLTTGLVLGAAIATPPPYYDTVYVGSTPYMYSDGVYLQPSGSEYLVVAPPPGATVNYLPDGCTSLVSNGNSYFNCSGIYYQPYFQNGTAVYRVVQL